MISRTELDIEARRQAFSLRQAEKDYIQHVVLHAIYTVISSLDELGHLSQVHPD